MATRHWLYIFILFANNICLASSINESIVIDSTKISWMNDGYEDEYARSIMIPIKNYQIFKSIIIAQYDDGYEIPYQFDLEEDHLGYFITIVDKEFDTRFVISGLNDYGITQTEFILHPADVKEPDVNGIQKEKAEEYSKVTIYTLSGMKVWDGTAEELKTATNLRPKGGYLIKTKKGTKKIFLAP